jgi:tripartite-type tricarboxylate transporter receptor subunit TctC
VHLAGENLVYQARIEAVHVPYKGENPGLASLAAGDIAFMVSNVAGATALINAGRLRPLGVTSLVEAPQLPGVPPIAKTLPGFENSGWFGLVAPAGTPKDIIHKLYLDTKKALEDTHMRAKLYAQGLAPVANSPEEMAKAMKAETALWKKVVTARHIEVK